MDALTQTLLRSIDERMPEVYEFLGKLIGYDTTNRISRGGELACQQFIYEHYKELGAQVEIYSAQDVPEILVHPDFEQGRDAEHRPNVTVFIPCADEFRATARRVMITSHTDTMPMGDRSLWRTDPFALTIRSGKAYGLGISDNKCGGGISNALYHALTRHPEARRHNVYLTAVSDEEYFGGNGSLLACLRYPCDLYINLDGCDGEPQIAGLGGTCFELSARYAGDTASCEQVVDALYYARHALTAFGQRRFDELERDPLYTGSEHAKSAYRLMEFGSGTLGTNVDMGKLKIVVYSTLKREALRQELDDLFAREIQPHFQAHRIESEGFQQIVRCMEYTATHDISAAQLMADHLQALTNRQINLRGACLSDLDIYLRNGSPDSFNMGLIREFKLEGGAHKPNEFIETKVFEAMAKAALLFLMDWKS